MKSTGIVRGVDGLGRIVLPKELRTSMKLDNDAKLEIFVEGDEIILEKNTAPPAAAISAARWTTTPSSMQATASAPPAARRSAACKK